VSGALVPYHQRQNKAVDRHLFIDLLVRLNRRLPIVDYTYVSFGGAFLEDFKLLHGAFGNRKLISLENDQIAWRRQQFNVPLSCISCLHQDSADFVAQYAIEGNAIVWLDYASAGETRRQFNEFQALLPKLRRYDIVKITFNANPNSLRDSRSADENGKRETAEVRNKKRFEVLDKRIGDFIPQEFNFESMTVDGYPRVLSKALEVAASEALKGQSNMLFQPLTSFTYNDLAHQMLTISGILLERSERVAFIRDCALRAFRLATLRWGDYKKIMLPALTARERLFIDQHLPRSRERTIQRKLKFWFDPDEDVSLEILKSYIEFYRQYPNFHRVLF